MQFNYAIGQLTTGTGTKRPSWDGYVKRVDGTDGAYTLTFKNKAGTEYAFAVSAAGVITTEATLTLDAELLTGLLADDWITPAAVADLETARGSTGTW